MEALTFFPSDAGVPCGEATCIVAAESTFSNDIAVEGELRLGAPEFLSILGDVAEVSLLTLSSPTKEEMFLPGYFGRF